jgi:hypothetical protein
MICVRPSGNLRASVNSVSKSQGADGAPGNHQLILSTESKVCRPVLLFWSPKGTQS